MTQYIVQQWFGIIYTPAQIMQYAVRTPYTSVCTPVNNDLVVMREPTSTHFNESSLKYNKIPKFKQEYQKKSLLKYSDFNDYLLVSFLLIVLRDI